MDNNIKALIELPKGSSGIIINLPPQQGLRERLIQMGLTPGTKIEIVENSRGPILIRARGVMIGIGRGMASRILVKVQ